MGNKQKKLERKLKTRVYEYETDGLDKNPAFKKPGSLNGHKQAPTDNPRRKGRRR